MPYVKCCHCREVEPKDIVPMTKYGITYKIGSRITERSAASSPAGRFMAGEYAKDMQMLVFWENGCPYCDGDGWLWENEGGEE